MNFSYLRFGLLAAIVLLFDVVTGQGPPPLNIPGAIQVGGPRTGVARSRRPVSLKSQQNAIAASSAPAQRVVEEAKPVTETADDDLPDVYLPHLLREQQLSSAQQAQFQQTVAAFLNGEGNAIAESPISHLLVEDDQPLITTPQYTNKLIERTLNPIAPSSRPLFNDFGIGANLIGSSQRFNNLDRVQTTPVTVLRERVNVIRSRPNAREPRPQYETQSLPAPAPTPAPVLVRTKPKPKPIQSRPLIEQNQLPNDRDLENKRRKRPVAQTIRKWRDENEDGSITWGYENDDGSFKEEFIGTDCVTKGTYGYVDPDGNKREYHYETGIKCDPNARRIEEEDYQNNGFINYEENKAILPNGIEIDMSQLGKKKSKRPLVNYRN